MLSIMDFEGKGRVVVRPAPRETRTEGGIELPDNFEADPGMLEGTVLIRGIPVSRALYMDHSALDATMLNEKGEKELFHLVPEEDVLGGVTLMTRENATTLRGLREKDAFSFQPILEKEEATRGKIIQLGEELKRRMAEREEPGA